MTRLTSWTFAVAATIAAIGCGDDGTGSGNTTLTIGAIVDLTGNNSQASFRDAITLAEEHANAGLEMARKDVRMRINIQDSQNQPSVAVQHAVNLAQNLDAKALVVDSSSNSIAVNTTFYDDDPMNDLGVPVQCSGCTSGSINNAEATSDDPARQNGMRDPDNWLTRTLMSTRLISKVMVRVIQDRFAPNGDRNGDGLFKLSIYHSDENFGTATAAAMKAFAEELHGTENLSVERIAHPRDADPNAYDWAGDAAKLHDNRNEETGMNDGEPDAVFMASFAQQFVSFVRARNAGNYDVPSMFVHTFRFQSTLDNLGSEANGEEGVSHVLIDNAEIGEAFAEAFRNRFGYGVSYRDSMYYDNAISLQLAVLKAALGMADPGAVTGPQVKQALSELNENTGEKLGGSPADFARAIQLMERGMAINYEGASGPMDYDETGNVRSKLGHYRVENQEFVDVAIYDCVSSDDCARE